MIPFIYDYYFGMMSRYCYYDCCFYCHLSYYCENLNWKIENPNWRIGSLNNRWN
jgi:hypothetical protein